MALGFLMYPWLFYEHTCSNKIFNCDHITFGVMYFEVKFKSSNFLYGCFQLIVVKIKYI